MSKVYRNDGAHDAATPVHTTQRVNDPIAGLSNAQANEVMPEKEPTESWLDQLVDFFTGDHDHAAEHGAGADQTSGEDHHGHDHVYANGHDPLGGGFGLFGGYEKPQTVAEPNQQERVAYELTGPREDPSYRFQGMTAAAHIYTIHFADGPSFPIIAPASPDPSLSYHTVEEAAVAASGIALASREQITSILLNPIENPQDPMWAAKYKDEDFESYMTAGGAGQITIYPSDSRTRNADQLNANMLHETGHIWAYKTWGYDKTRGGWDRWRQVMEYDGRSISTYADKDISEDVAETIQAYTATAGTERHDEYRRLVPNRFALLDREFAPELADAEQDAASERSVA